ncbi:MAG: hypothetical protein WC538_10855 [Thermoanaerobaculia bacterium]|jgi:hypothetical protein
MIRFNNLLPLVAAILLAVAAPASAQVYDTFVVPAVGNTPGGGGTVWASEVTVFNPQPYTLFVSMTFLPSGLQQGSEVLVQIPSNQFFATSNVLNDVYHRTGTGSLLLATFPEDNKHVPNPTILDLSFVVRSNTFNNASGGTFGQAIPGVISGLMDFEYEKLSAISTGIRNFGVAGQSGFRTNVGALNLGRYTVRMLVNVYDELGRTVAKDIPFDIPPQGHVQDSLPVTIDRGTIEYFIDDPGVNDPDGYAVVFAYASVIDNKSGDPVYVEPILLANPSYLYGKVAPKDPLTVGKKIDKDYARRVRQSAERVGIATMLTRDDGTRSVSVTR